MKCIDRKRSRDSQLAKMNISKFKAKLSHSGEKVGGIEPIEESFRGNSLSSLFLVVI